MKPTIMYRFSCKDHNCNYFSADEYAEFSCDDCGRMLQLDGVSEIIRKTKKELREMYRQNEYKRTHPNTWKRMRA